MAKTFGLPDAKVYIDYIELLADKDVDDQLIFNRGRAGMLVEETLTAKGNVAFFEGVHVVPGITEAR